jgi:hypothetical protein
MVQLFLWMAVYGFDMIVKNVYYVSRYSVIKNVKILDWKESYDEQ